MTAAPLWRVWDPSVRPSPGDVHVWRLELNHLASHIDAFRPILSVEERERAARFHFEKDSRAYVVSHAILRKLLGHWMGTDPAALAFQHGVKGKPFLLAGPEFNVSHSAHLALVALSLDRAVGVDIEQIRDRACDAGLTAFFSPPEVEELESLPENDRLCGFFAGWTRKEAFLKARGDGISLGLQRFAVTVNPWLPPRLKWIDGDAGEPLKWEFHCLPDEPGFASAVCAAGAGWKLFCWNMTE